MRLSVVQRFVLRLAVIAMIFAAAILVSMSPPWLGGHFVPESGSVVVASVSPVGPLAGSVSPGDRLTGILSGDRSIALIEDDLIQEPDSRIDYVFYNAIIARVDMIADLLTGPVTLSGTRADGTVFTAEVTPQEHRPITALPFIFWFQGFVSVVVLAIGAWVASIRASSPAAVLFALSGYCIGISMLAAAVYSSRELALSHAAFRTLSLANHAGALGYGACMVGVFARYPTTLSAYRLFAVSTVVAAAIFVLDLLQWPSFMSSVFYAALASALAVVVVLFFIQYRATRHPADRKSLIWVAMSFLLGGGGFIALIALPILVAEQSIISQAYSFGFMLLFYCGIAFGLLRYRLFDLDRWAFELLTYVLAAMLFVIIDVIMISVFTLGATTSIVLTAAFLGLFYLPIRNVLTTRFLTSRDVDPATLYRASAEIALQATPEARAERWKAALNDHFRPLVIQPTDIAAERPLTDMDGEILYVPAYPWCEGLELRYYMRGRKLFGQPHERMVANFADLVRTADENRRAYDMGVKEERRRIARDLHDNVGAMLLSGLRATDHPASRRFIRDALSDVREIVNGLSDRREPLSHVIAQMRAETLERLSDIEIDWPLSAADEAARPLPYETYRSLTSTHREFISNILKHAPGAKWIRVRTTLDDGWLQHEVVNDLGLPRKSRADARGGNGHINLAGRAAALEGGFDFEVSDRSAISRIRLPLATAGTEVPA